MNELMLLIHFDPFQSAMFMSPVVDVIVKWDCMKWNRIGLETNSGLYY